MKIEVHTVNMASMTYHINIVWDVCSLKKDVCVVKKGMKTYA